MRLIVTGGAGFIGSHIAARALEEGHDVCVIDDLSTGHRVNVPEGAEFSETDIRDEAEVSRVVTAFKPDAISHQAAQASVAISVREPARDASINVIGSLNVLEAAKKVGARIVYASTGGALYGEVPEGTCADVHTPMRPMSPYACSKASFESYLDGYRTAYGLESTVLRYANVYGPRQDPHGEAGVVAIFFQRALRGDKLQVNARKQLGDDGCVRDYVYVGDVVRANMAALGGKLSESIVNVGTGVPTTTRTLAQSIRSLSKSDCDILDGDHRVGDLERSVLDPQGFVAAVGEPLALQVGLQETGAWFAAQVRAQKES